MIDTLARRCLEGDPRAVARLISLLEDGDRDAFGSLATLKERTGFAHVIGITGPPGSGKSTLTDKLIGRFRAEGKRVGVIAVDPSSPFSGGAILGDRLRMQGHATDPGVFIRSLASRGRLGGLSKATAFAARVLEAAGYDIVIIETVGVGQSEVDIVKVADTVVLVSVPGLGDDIQVIKAGIMEIGDIFVVNKSDRDGADRVLREIRAMLETQAMLRRGRSVDAGPDTLAARNTELLHHGQLDLRPETLPSKADPFSLPPVLKTVAETGEGVPELCAAILGRFETMKASGELEVRRHASIKSQLKDLVSWQVMEYFADQDGDIHLENLARDVRKRDIDIYTASRELFLALLKGERR
ncbi:MAG: methylmalonyl Co-A mutase-associated GTPase MeaB [Rectinemataceae bacterium]